MNKEPWLDASSYPLSDAKHIWLAQLGAAALVVLVALAVALFPVDRSSWQSIGNYTGLPDGNRAVAIYALDSGYGLGELQYAEAVSKLRGKDAAHSLPEAPAATAASMILR